ncbi:hypothetical protein [Methanothrix soehngenii]|uniref:hypothetical protein n=1 Tax=Methanothrix soehngenii TaxID=2223 RepID=UPI00300D18A5
MLQIDPEFQHLIPPLTPESELEALREDLSRHMAAVTSWWYGKTIISYWMGITAIRSVPS